MENKQVYPFRYEKSKMKKLDKIAKKQKLTRSQYIRSILDKAIKSDAIKTVDNSLA
jgi:predicted DNA-binding protein